jgi:WD40 repeat protein
VPTPRFALACLLCLAALASPLWAAAPPRPNLDRHGDPLPKHAVARLGTVRFYERHGVGSLGFSRDGKSLAVANHYGTRFWAVPGGKHLGTRALNLRYQRNESPLLFPSREGLHLAKWEGEHVVIRDAADGKEVRKLPKGDYFPEAVTLDGRLAATREQRTTIVVWDFLTGKEVHSFDSDTLGRVLYTLRVAFTPDGKSLASCDSGEKPGIQFWDVKTGKPLRHLKVGTRMPQAVAFSPDGKVMAVSSCMDLSGRRTSERDYSLTLHDAVSGKQLRTLSVFGGVSDVLAFSPDGKTLAVGRRQSIELYDVATGKPLTPACHKWAVEAVAFRPCGKQIVTLGGDRVVRVWSPDGAPIQTVSLQKRRPWEVALSADGGRVAWAGDDDPTPQVRDLVAGKDLPRIELGEEGFSRLTLSPRGDALALWTANRPDEKGARLWDLKKYAPIRLPKPAGKELSAVALSPGARLLLAAELPRVTVARTDGALRPLRLDTPASGAAGFALSADHRTLATSHHDGTIVLWEVASGKRRGPATKHSSKYVQFARTAPTAPLSLSPDGTLLASGGIYNDGDVRIWDVATGKELCRFTGHTRGLYGLAFSPDGKLLVSASADHTALVWDVAGAVGVRKRPAPSAKRLRACWDDLAGEDASKAHQAVWDLSAAPRETVALLWDRVKPAKAASLRSVRGWIAELDSDDPDVREAATKALAGAGQGALPAVREAAKSPSLEVRRRAGLVIEALTEPVVAGETLRALRAVEALERIGTERARRLLLRLAGGPPEARLTQEADAALRRLTGRAG